MQPTKDPIAPANQDITRSEGGDDGEAVATIAMTALPFQGEDFPKDDETLAQASTIDIKGDEVESWLQQAQQTKPPSAEKAEGKAEERGKEFRTMVESPAVASVPNAAAVKAPHRMSRPTQPTIAEAPPVSVASAPSVPPTQPTKAPPPAHASATVADMQAFTPPPKRPTPPQPSGAPPWTIAVIGLLVVAILVTLLALLGVF